MYKNFLFFLGLFSFAHPSWGRQALCCPSFDCSRAKTTVEKAICKSLDVSRLDNILAKVYTHLIRTSKNPGKIKADQLKWLEERDKSFNEHEDIKKLFDQYFYRIIEMLKEEEAYIFFLKNFIEKKSGDASLLVMSAITFLQERQKRADWFDLPEQILEKPMIIHLVKRKGVVLGLEISRGGYSFTYEFFLLSEKKGKVVIEPFSLPQLPKKLNAPERSNALEAGQFSLEKKGDKSYLSYSPSISSGQTEKKMTWEIGDNGAKIVREPQPLRMKRPAKKPIKAGCGVNRERQRKI